MNYKFTFENTKSVRIDLYLAEVLPEYSRSLIQKIAKTDNIKVNGKIVKSNHKLSDLDVIEITIPEVQKTTIEAEDIPIDVVYEDEHLIVINKAKGMVVHPALGNNSGTLVNAILAHSDNLSGVGGEERPGIVHRLDKNTSGLMVVAKSDIAHHSLQEQIQDRKMKRKYKALVIGVTDFNEAKIDAPIGRHPSDRQKMAVIEDTDRYTARNAITHVTVLKRYRYFTLIEAALETGRTHQIRVHMSYIKYPVLGDKEYGGVKRNTPFPCSKPQEKEFLELFNNLNGQMLHAYKLSFYHPITNELLEFEKDVPKEFDNMLEFFDKVCPV